MSIPQSPDDLQAHFAEQLNFLDTSIDAYDQGNSSEAKRLATTLRLLLHDTRHSTSLLSQLGLKNRSFCDTSDYECYNRTPWDVGLYTGLIGQCINITTNSVTYIPILDHQGDHHPQWIDFETWWNMIVIKDEIGNTFSRRDLVLTMADQDGGAHVDPVITDKYAAITRQNTLGWKGAVGNTQYRPLPYPERAAVRQIAHEVRKSLDPHYTKNVDQGEIYFVAYNMVILLEPLKKKIGRNESCPCGSGKKYKFCHGSI